MRRRAWFRVHSFTGVITGLLLFVICWSGTFATLGHELDWLVTPAARVEPGGAMRSWGAWRAALERAYPEAELRWLSAPLYPVSAAEAVVDLPDQDFVRIYIDPYRAEVQGRHSYVNIQRFLRSFHKDLFSVAGVGDYLVVAFSLTLLGSTIAALAFYKRWWTRFFRFSRGRGRVLWSELHKTAGVWCLWFALLMGVTGAWYFFEELRFDLGDGKVIYAGTSDSSVRTVPEPESDPSRPRLPIDALLARVRALRPELELRTVSPDFGPEGALYVDGQAGHWLVRSRANQVRLDARTGEILYSQEASELPLYWRWSHTADPLHFGDFAGLVGKGIWCAFGLALSGLVATGTLLHARRLAREAGGKGRHRWPGTLAAAGVSVAVVLASVPCAFYQSREAFGPTVDGAKQLPALAPGVAAVMLAWVALTLAILAGWVVLLWRPEVLGSRRRARSRGPDVLSPRPPAPG